jgi:hypothetical protein
MMDFDDYIVNYPLPDDPMIQEKITNRQEFYELRAIKQENQVPGKFFKHQRIFARYMRYYDRVFNIHETGTGKTGSIIATAEMFKRLNQGINKVVILFPGKFTLQDFQSQLVKFMPEYGDKDEKVRNKKIKKWYELNTYRAFAGELRTQPREEIQENYSNTLFFLDEVHNLRNYTQTQDVETYETIWSLLHMTHHTKIALGSATPMVNRVEDFVPLINLILPADQQISLQTDFSALSSEALEKVLRGKISFVRASGNKLEIKDMGNSLKTRVKLKIGKNPNIMFVKRSYNQDLRMEDEEPIAQDEALDQEEPQERTVISDTKITLLETEGLQRDTCIQTFRQAKQEFSLKQKYASTFVFPDGSLGVEGYRKYMTLDTEFRDIPGKDDLNTLLGRDGLTRQEKLENLRQMSVKFHFYISNELLNKNQGKSFCYIEDVRGGGMYLLARILDQFGFQRFDNMAVMSDKGVNSTFPRMERYALLTSDMDNDNTLRLFNSKENKNGDYIRLIIASKAARDGINLSNVVRGYVISPLWNDAGMYQAISRFIRATSHEDLIEDLAEGQKLTVKIYRLAAYVASEEFDSVDILDERGNIRNYDDKQLLEFSNDLYTYRLSDTKDVSTRIKLEDMKLNAFDFILNYNRNYSDTNRSGTKTTGYGPRTPMPRFNFVKNITTNTKYLLYHDEELDALENRARELLLKNNVIPLDQLAVPGVDNIYTSIFIKERIPYMTIQDNFGIPRKVVYRNDSLYVQLDNHFMSIEPRKVMVDETPVQIETTELDVFIRQIMESQDMESKIREKLEDKFPDTPNQLLVQGLLEQVVIRLRNGDQDPKLSAIYRMFEPYIHSVAYPHNAVAKATELFNVSAKGPGRTPKKYAFARIKNNIEELSRIEQNDDITYYHFFQPALTKPSVSAIFSTVFEVTTKKRMVRILRRDKQNFEDATDVELPIFQLYYIDKLKRWMDTYIQQAESDVNVIGSIFRDGTFRLLTPETSTNKQGMYTGGKACRSFNPYNLIFETDLYKNVMNMDFSNTDVYDFHRELTETPEDDMRTYLRQINVTPSSDVREQYFKNKLNDKIKGVQCAYLSAYFQVKGYLMKTF